MDQTHTGVAAALSGTRSWVRLVGVLGIIASVMMMAVGVAMAAFGSAFPGAPGDFQGGMAVLGLFYACMALLYLVPSIYLWRYGARIQEYLLDPQEATLARALEQQRKFWKFVGVLALISMAFFFLGLIAGIAAPFLMRNHVGG